MRGLEIGTFYRVRSPKPSQTEPSRRPGVPALLWDEGLTGTVVACTESHWTLTRAATRMMEYRFTLDCAGEKRTFSVLGTSVEEVERRLKEQFEPVDS